MLFFDCFDCQWVCLLVVSHAGYFPLCSCLYGLRTSFFSLQESNILVCDSRHVLVSRRVPFAHSAVCRLIGRQWNPSTMHNCVLLAVLGVVSAVCVRRLIAFAFVFVVTGFDVGVARG